MEWSLHGKPERVGPVDVEDIRRNLLSDFNALLTQESVQSQPENLQVFLRIRPFTSAESNSGKAQDCVTMEGPDSVTLKAPKSMKCQTRTAQRFTFTQVFGPDSSQRTVFEGSVRPLVRDVLDGGNCLVFTYGITNAGKTFTFLGPDHDCGLLPRSLAVIFRSLENRLYSGCDLKPLRCRDYSRLSPEQQSVESATKTTLLRTHKESDQSLTSGRSTFLDGSALTDSSLSSVSETDSFSLDVDSSVRFSVWVSFCEIYNDNIHDLLEQVPNGHQRRTVLRLSQDVKGNSFIKDLRWVQVNNSEEAYRILKIGKKNQSFSSTRLNLVSSRSHSIFSVRILKIHDVGVPRVLGISELSLCDLAGSERCSRTQNTGDRLKEAGNINSSLLTLGKCISAMRLNQNAKFQHHVPFRESKLTHFLQFFFCGAGRVTMVVNINQNQSSFDETLNVLKFSALAQKVVVLSTRPQPLEPAPQRSAMELSMILDEAASRRLGGRKSSLVAWETSLEDVLETVGVGVLGEDEEEGEDEGTVLEAADGEDTTVEEGLQSDTALRLVLEAQIREEVSAEFMELFNKMEKDYSERLEKEREILEERAEKRVEILKNLVSRTVDMSALSSQVQQDPEGGAVLEGLISSMSEDLERIREDTRRVHRCLMEPQSAELEALRWDQQQSLEQLQAAHQVTEPFNRTDMDTRKNCSCLRKQGIKEGNEPGKRKRQRNSTEDESTPAKKRGLLEDEIWRLQEENEVKEQLITELALKQTRLDQDRTSLEQDRTSLEQDRTRLDQDRTRLEQDRTSLEQDRASLEQDRASLDQDRTSLDQDRTRLEQDRTSLEQDRTRLQEEVERLRTENTELENRIQQLTAEVESCPHCVSVLLSLELEQKETSRLNKENKALVNGIFQLQNQVTDLQKQLRSQTDMSESLSNELNSTKSRLQSQSDERAQTIDDLSQELDRLRQEAKEEGVFHEAMDRLKQESEVALKKSVKKTQQVQDLQEKLQTSERLCAELREESSNHRAEFESLEAGLREECGSLKQKLEEMERSAKEERREMEKLKQDLLEAVSLREQTLVESQRQTEELRAELQHLREHLQSPAEEEEEEEKENQVQRKVTVVEELREELNKLQQRKNMEQNRDPEPRPTEDQKMEAVRREVERFKELQNQSDVQSVSPVKTTSDRRKTPRTTSRKRKSCEGLHFSENKKNRTRANLHKQTSPLRDRPLQKLGDFLHKSPSILSSSAKGLVDLVLDSSRTTGSKQRRGRRKLYKPTASSPMINSPDLVFGGPFEEKESDHLKIKRQLRSKTCRK